MQAANRTKRSRRGFTLVEMLAVVAIIGILVSMVTAAAYMARVRVKIGLIAMEAKQLEAACHAYRERVGEFPPDGTEGDAAIVRHVRRALPLWRGTDAEILLELVDLNPGTALMFFLGGPQDASGRPIGFSPNPRDPLETNTTEGRIGPFYEFKADQRNRTLNDYYYFPPGVSKTDATGVFVYFRSYNGDYTGKTCILGTATPVTVTPVRDGRIGGATRPWANPESCQIICGGLDGRIGTGTNFPEGTAVAPYTAYDEFRWDDQSNFTKGTFGDARD